MTRAAVIGAGTMGNGIAHVFAQHGWDVALVDSAPAALEKAGATIRANLDRQVKKGAIAGRTRRRQMLARLSDRHLARRRPRAPIWWSRPRARTPRSSSRSSSSSTGSRAPDAILATNTSSISITEIAARTRRPEQVIGMHFMNPVPVMQLVEVIRGHATSDATTRDGDGDRPRAGQDAGGGARLSRASSSNRVLMPMINEAIFCVMEGVATPEAIDTVMKLGMAHPMGPLALADFIGLDVCLAILDVLHGAWATTSIAPARCCAAWWRRATWARRRAGASTTYSGKGERRLSGHLRVDADPSATSSCCCPTTRRAATSASSRSTTPRWPRARRHPLLAVRQHRRGDHRRAAARPRHDLQGGGRRASTSAAASRSSSATTAGPTARRCSGPTAGSSRR